MSDPAMTYLLERFIDFQVIPFGVDYPDDYRPDIVRAIYDDNTTRNRELVANQIGTGLIFGSGYSSTGAAAPGGYFDDRWNRTIQLADNSSYGNHEVIVV